MTAKYQILARKYRPQIFKDVIGQDSVVKTIKNSIRYKRVAHAYLFSGTRGTGKTTLTRLFAKALNCKNLKEDFEPCNECQSCNEISASRSLDVIEIDGASNRGIDDIRQINDTIGYSPSGKYKIYIIDEVHMLTKEAFNALLKTLEEPPENIKFFFATTEPHKVLPTIISRCQRFELKRISNELIIEKLQSISSDLKREIDKEALYQIANFSDGSLRDAESLLDQIFCYSEGKITLEYINQALGFIDHNILFELDSNIYNLNTSYAFEFIDKINSSGKDLTYFVEELVEHFKNLLIIKMQKNSLDFLPENIKNQYLSSSKLFTESQIFYILDTLTNAIAANKNSFKRIHLEMLILKIIKSKNSLPIDVLVKRLIDLEKSISQNDSAISNNATQNPGFEKDGFSIQPRDQMPKTPNNQIPDDPASKKIESKAASINESKQEKPEEKAAIFNEQPNINLSNPTSQEKPPHDAASDLSNTSNLNESEFEKIDFSIGQQAKAQKISDTQVREDLVIPTISKNNLSSGSEPKQELLNKPTELLNQVHNSNLPISESQKSTKKEQHQFVDKEIRKEILNESIVAVKKDASEPSISSNATTETKDQSHYDTLIKFAQIELNGMNKT
ncbi:MAG: DNA polymerase III subunit gamma/tau [Parachlamydiales bacterium]|jgi:DNA polymerase-3 subunit gamma/tau